MSIRARVAIALSLSLSLASSLAATACHHDKPPPPLAVRAPATPIGYLLEAATDLHLTDDQRALLKAIDRELTEQLAALDQQARHATGGGSGSAAKPRVQMTGGGRRGGGGGGRRGGAPMGAGEDPDAAAHRRAVIGDQLADARAQQVRDALTHALAVLDPSQRPAAAKILDDHDIDLDADHPQQPDETGDAP